MNVPKDIINITDLPPVPNICNQTLREVIAMQSVSLAHIIMASGNSSLLHSHEKMHEVYYILEGHGILYSGTDAVRVNKDSYLIIPSGNAHKLHNNSSMPLEHLVLASPPFDPSDIKLINENSFRMQYSEPKLQKSLRKWVYAEDGALVCAFFSEKERKQLGYGLASGLLPKGRTANQHHHDISEEVYYVLSGDGIIYLKTSEHESEHEIGPGSVIHIPKSVVHGLENVGDKELRVLCVSDPPYSDGDFIRE